MKKLVIIISGMLFLAATMSSCGGGYTCPTYSKMDNHNLTKIKLEEQI